MPQPWPERTELEPAESDPPQSRHLVARGLRQPSYFAISALCVHAKLPPDVVGFIGNCTGALAVEIVCNREPVDPIVRRRPSAASQAPSVSATA